MDSLIVRLLSLPEVQSSIPYSTSQIWRLEQQGHFPKRVRIGPNRVGWIEAEINDWLSSKIKERGQ
jgi:prophage regulatory protein